MFLSIVVINVSIDLMANTIGSFSFVDLVFSLRLKVITCASCSQQCCERVLIGQYTDQTDRHHCLRRFTSGNTHKTKGGQIYINFVTVL